MHVLILIVQIKDGMLDKFDSLYKQAGNLDDDSFQEAAGYLTLENMTLNSSLVGRTPWARLAEGVYRGQAAATMQYVRHTSALLVSPRLSVGKITW